MTINTITSKGSDKSKGWLSSGFGVPMGNCKINIWSKVSIVLMVYTQSYEFITGKTI